MKCWQCDNVLEVRSDTITLTLFENMDDEDTRIGKGMDLIVNTEEISKIKELANDNIEDKYKRSNGEDKGHHIICGECYIDRLYYSLKRKI